MKKFIAALSVPLILFSCSSGTKSPDNSTSIPYTLDTFPREWIAVEQEESRWVIYEPCDSSTPEIKIERENGKDVFTVLSGQAADPYTLEKLEQTEDGSVIINTKIEGDTQALKFTFHKTPTTNIWSVIAPDNIETYYIEKQHSASFAKVVQPCRECWDDEQCAEMEKNK